jgi:hypothetical protein
MTPGRQALEREPTDAKFWASAEPACLAERLR